MQCTCQFVSLHFVGGMQVRFGKCNLHTRFHLDDFIILAEFGVMQAMDTFCSIHFIFCLGKATNSLFFGVDFDQKNVFCKEHASMVLVSTSHPRGNHG